MVRYFVEVAREGSFTRAAAGLGISQPALSQQVKRFEEQIGVTLVDRTRAGAELTAAGEAMLREGEHLLAAAARAVRWTREMASPASAERVRLGFVPGTPRSLVTVALRSIDRFGDTAKLVLHRVEWSQQAACLVSGSADIAFVQLPMNNNGLRAIGLRTERRVASFHRGHRLARRRRLVMADLKDEPILDAEYNRDFWIVNPRPDGSTPVVVAPCASTAEEMLALVASGRGMAITSRSLADAYPRSDVSFVTIADLVGVTYGVGWRESESRSLIHHLVETIAGELVPDPESTVADS
jgi:DNA-binding transcriptional LysR family regulator